MIAVSQTETISPFRGIYVSKTTYLFGIIPIFKKSKVIDKKDCTHIFRELELNKVLHQEDKYIEETFKSYF